MTTIITPEVEAEQLLLACLGGDVAQVERFGQAIKNIYQRRFLSMDAWASSLEELSAIDRQTAFRVICCLPDPLIYEQISQEGKQLLPRLRHSYLGLSAWLLHWEKQGQVQTLIQNNLAQYQPLALLSKRKFDLIEGLFDRKRFSQDFYRKSSVWLLSELSICAGHLRNLDIQYQKREGDLLPATSKRKAWKTESQVISDLGNFSRTTLELFPLELEMTWGNILENFQAILEYIARVEAESNSTFDRQYYKPYLLARSAYNTATLNNPVFQLLSPGLPKRRGPKLKGGL